MDINTVLLPVLSLGSMGLIFGLGLGYAGVKFNVEENPDLCLIREVLPGANCGGCGFAGCDAFASAVIDRTTAPNGCPVGGAECASKIGDILGIKVEAEEKKVSFVKCSGACSKSKSKYNYFGLNDCGAAIQLAGGGSRSCMYSCLGNGSCVTACQFNAISIIDGIAVVDKEKCTACKRCIDACPKHLLELLPYDSKIRVGCNSHDTGKEVRAHCSVGCISCKLCEKACEYDAIKVENNLAVIDYEKCTMCNACVEKCPTGVINNNR